MIFTQSGAMETLLNANSGPQSGKVPSQLKEEPALLWRLIASSQKLIFRLQLPLASQWPFLHDSFFSGGQSGPSEVHWIV